jgi:hypothetical protein
MLSFKDITAITITGTLGLLLVVCGIVMLTGCGSFLIAGFNTTSKNEKEKYDKTALCKFKGKIILPISILCPCLVISNMFEILWFPCVFAIIVLGLIIFAGIYVNTGNRFLISK